MRCNILLYGATGYSGRLIAAEGMAAGMSDVQAVGDFRMILAARDGAKLSEVGKSYCMPCRRFALDDVDEVKKHLDGIDVIINAAGPFAFTTDKLVKAALELGCHYVDITGEVDVYRTLDDFARAAAQRNIAIVSGAGYMAAASDILLDLALQKLTNDNVVAKDGELGAVRIALSSITDSSRGGVQTLVRSLREQVIVIRKAPAMGRRKERMVVWHEPVGKLEHTFDFRRPSEEADRPKDSGCEIGIAANLIDTLTAQLTVHRHRLLANTIVSYVEAGTMKRVAYQASAMFASLGSCKWMRALMRAQLPFVPAEPAQKELDKERNVVVLEIEDVYRTRLIDWRLETPDVYQFTAQVAVAAARNIASGRKIGWVTPADALDFRLEDKPGKDAPGFRLRYSKRGKDDSGLVLRASPVAASVFRDTWLETRLV
jgi:short subunit dehydrogenase-like uncharacterized protein